MDGITHLIYPGKGVICGYFNAEKKAVVNHSNIIQYRHTGTCQTCLTRYPLYELAATDL